jgi:hypothetical protein
MASVNIVYIDESGDKGWASDNSPTDFFVLGCVIVHESFWLANVDALVNLRRQLKKRWGINTRTELKSEDFRWGHGALEGLDIGLRDRMNIYKDVMEYQSNVMNTSNFAIAIQKSKIKDKSRDGRHWAWVFALQRINRFCRGGERAIIFPDEGHATFAQRLVRQMRRYHTITGHYGDKLEIPIQLIVEDPQSRKSHDSYFIQVADWNAYAARRSRYIEPTKKVRRDLWDKLGNTLLLQVNELTGGWPPGIVKWP